MKTTFFFSNSCNAPRALRTQFSVVLKNQNKSQRIVLRIKSLLFQSTFLTYLLEEDFDLLQTIYATF